MAFWEDPDYDPTERPNDWDPEWNEDPIPSDPFVDEYEPVDED